MLNLSKSLAKSLFVRAISGALVGLIVNRLVAIFVSIAYGGTEFMAIDPRTLAMYKNPVLAAFTSDLLVAILGIVWFCIHLIWKNEGLSLLARTLIHYVIGTATTLAVALGLNWISGPGAIIGFVLMLSLVYLIIWICIYLYMAHQIRVLNKVLGTKA